MKKEPKYKVGTTWWVGWVLCFPARLAFCMLVAIIKSCSPEAFYGELNNKILLEKDQSQWRAR